MALNEVVGGIYSCQPLPSRCWRWAHPTVRWRTGQPLFTVRCVPRQRVRQGLEQLIVGAVCLYAAPDSLVHTGQSGDL
jgi:hypothetical protein